MSPKSPSPSSVRPAPRTSSRRGFALLITITLLAFLVLLLVSLASLTRVETQVASNSQSLAQARQNALMALNIALGQLQKYTGPDQRVTATADIAAASDGGRLASNGVAQNTASVRGILNGLRPTGATASIQAGSRYWTGAWGRAGGAYATPAQSIYQETPSPVLLNWLVSGNENRTVTLSADGLVSASTADGRSAGATAPFTPGDPINWSAAGLNPNSPSTWSSNSFANLEIKTAGQKAVLLVGPKTAGTDPIGAEVATERYIVAPLKDIDVPASSVPGLGSGSTPTVVGRYAWWVGDEGVKASYAVADPNAGQTDPSSSEAARLRLMTASRSGIELVSDWQDYPGANDTTAAIKFSRVLDLRQVPMLTASLTQEKQRAAFHSFARLSQGLLTNSLTGGLRKDLTYHFETPAAWNASPLKGSGIIPPPYSPDWGASNLGPKWDWLYSFYNTNPSVSSPSLAMRPESATDVGVAPVITQFRMIVTTSAAATMQAIPNLKNLNNNTDYKLPVRCNVVFVLANPYNFTLTAPAGSLEFVLNNTSTRDTTNALLLIHGPVTARSTYYLLRNPSDTSPPGGLLDTVRFLAPALSIPPGESITLSVAGSSQIASATNTVGASPANTIDLAVNSGSNPVKSTDYFTGGTTFDFRTDAANRIANMAQTNYANVSITLRRSGGGAIYQQLYDTLFSKEADNGLSSLAGTVFGSAHIRLLTPAQRNLDWNTPIAPATTNNQKFTLALFAYARTYQDFNIRASRVRPPNVTPNSGTQVILTPPPYAGGILYRLSSGNENLIFNSFTQDLHPAPWAENFGQMNEPSVNYRGTEADRGILFDFPRRTASQLPVLSIGQLQHASITTDDKHPDSTTVYQSSYTIGNSYHTPFVTRGSSIQTRNNSYTLGGAGTTRYFDLSYLLNTALWDGYFFSGITQQNALAVTNPRYEFNGTVSTSEARSANSAEHLLVKGAFNINSTSKDAWVAFLGGLNGLRVNTDPEARGVPYPRTLWQTEHSDINNNAFKTSGTGDNAYAGYRRLTVDEIGLLADEIVKRVRARGPFVSLSHFINRTLVAASADFNADINDADGSGRLAYSSVPMGRGLSGPLQAALDSNVSKINTFQTVNGDVVTPDGSDEFGDRVLFNGEVVHSTQYKPNYNNTASVYFADKAVDSPHIEWDITKKKMPGPAGRTSTATPGWLLQGDILQALGPALSPRSDTFVIRAYGEVVNPTDANQKTAQAWCEALVQRSADYVETADSPETDHASLTSPTNKLFGRGYKVIGFRWLTAEDI
jgi:hypothetical protein